MSNVRPQVSAAETLKLEALRDEQVPELIRMWRASFEEGVGLVDPHPVEEQEDYFSSEVRPHHTVRVAMRGGGLVGFVAANTESVSQLYVRVGVLRQGIGSFMLNWAKEQSAGKLSLFTFERNRRACAFYEHHQFVAVERGLSRYGGSGTSSTNGRAPGNMQLRTPHVSEESP
jgi:GNAT superfamily N-acetyltransferase